MSKYMVNIVTTYVVEAEDEDDAVDIAIDEVQRDLKSVDFNDIFACDAEELDD